MALLINQYWYWYTDPECCHGPYSTETDSRLAADKAGEPYAQHASYNQPLHYAVLAPPEGMTKDEFRTMMQDLDTLIAAIEQYNDGGSLTPRDVAPRLMSLRRVHQFVLDHMNKK